MKTESVLREINQYFGFLYDKGFKIQSAAYHPESFGNWEIILKSTSCIVEISNDRNEILVEFVPLYRKKDRIGLREMIYFLSQGQEFLSPFEGNLFWGKKKQLKEMASLLQEHVDKMCVYFGESFDEYRAELLSAQKKYNQLAVDIYAKRKKIG